MGTSIAALVSPKCQTPSAQATIMPMTQPSSSEKNRAMPLSQTEPAEATASVTSATASAAGSTWRKVLSTDCVTMPRSVPGSSDTPSMMTTTPQTSGGKKTRSRRTSEPNTNCTMPAQSSRKAMPPSPWLRPAAMMSGM